MKLFEPEPFNIFNSAPPALSDVHHQTLPIVTCLRFSLHALFIIISHHSWPTSDLSEANPFLVSLMVSSALGYCVNVKNFYISSDEKRTWLKETCRSWSEDAQTLNPWVVCMKGQFCLLRKQQLWLCHFCHLQKYWGFFAFTYMVVDNKLSLLLVANLFFIIVIIIINYALHLSALICAVKFNNRLQYEHQCQKLTILDLWPLCKVL